MLDLVRKLYEINYLQVGSDLNLEKTDLQTYFSIIIDGQAR